MKNQSDKLNQTEAKDEYAYRVEERIGQMTEGKQEPSLEETELAHTEALEALATLTDACHLSCFRE